MDLNVGTIREIIKHLPDDVLLATLELGNDSFDAFTGLKRVMLMEDKTGAVGYGIGKRFMVINKMGSHFSGEGEQKGLEYAGEEWHDLGGKLTLYHEGKPELPSVDEGQLNQRSGATTRIIDELVQEYFTTGRVIIRDHYEDHSKCDKQGNLISTLRILQSRLFDEHHLKQNADYEIKRNNGPLRIEKMK